MFLSYVSHILLSALLVTCAVIVRDDTVDPDSPEASDPKEPHQIMIPPRSPNLFKGKIATAPVSCTNLRRPSEQCLKDMQAQSGDKTVVAFGGGRLIWDTDNRCSNEQKDKFETAAWDAHTLASVMDEEPNEHNGRDVALWRTYIGPDFATQQKRITDNFKRAAEFKPQVSGSFDIYLSCNDKTNNCTISKDGMRVGGYADNYKGWFGREYYYITMCEPFFLSDDLDEKLLMIKEEVDGGKLEKAQLAVWQKNTGQMFLHEMMHLHSVGQPEIGDKTVNPGNIGPAAYGPNKVHMLARYKLSEGGGATRASINADSYAWLANSKFFYDVTGFFPRPSNYKAADDSNNYTRDDWIREHDGFILNLGPINETTTDAEIDKRIESILDSMALPSPDPSTGKALVIAMVTNIAAHGASATVDNRWHFYTTRVGHTLDCNYASDPDMHEIESQGPSSPILSGDLDPKVLPWAGGDFKLEIDSDECHYKCDGTNAGRVFCPKKEYSCKEDPARTNSGGLLKCDSYSFFHAAIWCEL